MTILFSYDYHFKYIFSLHNATIPLWCPHCKEEVESTYHAFFSCDFVQAVWRIGNLWTDIEGCSSLCPGDILQFVLMSLQPPARERFAIILWQLWDNRNKLIFQQKLTLL
ncbi:hypothetical protein ACOSP7_009873 [Xanthoceras sorbifolium]